MSDKVLFPDLLSPIIPEDCPSLTEELMSFGVQNSSGENGGLTNSIPDSRLGLATISGKSSEDIGKGTPNCIPKEAGLVGAGEDV